MSASLSAPPPVSGLHFIQVVHAAGWLDEKSSVGPAVAVAVAPNSTVVREGAGWLSIEGVAMARLPHSGSRTCSCNKIENVV